MPSKKLPNLNFYRVGEVERGSKYTWRTAYSLREDGGVQPWFTLPEAQTFAKSEGKRAVFLEPKKPA